MFKFGSTMDKKQNHLTIFIIIVVVIIIIVLTAYFYAKSIPTGDISELPRFSLSKIPLSESFADGLWHLSILLLWNVMLALLSPLVFLRYDVR